MSQISQTPQTPLTTDYDLRDAFRLLKKEVMLDLNCHAIGTIQSFSSANQTATATINYQRTLYKIDPTTQAQVSYLQPYPLLVDCPVICLGGGATALTFPIAGGDECLILFNDRNLDNWFVSNIGGAVSTSRLHSFTDAIILVGLRSAAHVISSYDSTHAVLRNSTGAKVGVHSTNPTVLIKGLTLTLGQALQTFCTACEGSGDSTLAAAATALAAALTGILE